ncbi:hypothetical protein NEF87_005054 [Candidatus Lokiarchaeum ossiferum]|uniref:DEAD/DEAH box helicase n=1 Tax=Candidatus Lokiarchaeum ossiferum TaxID=2951803 RepID=A0ABY6I1T7_9ARCH|nr:hypothetical protein NEF87_005054 [Candidatus Lokiarchaeum sp. B-35]
MANSDLETVLRNFNFPSKAIRCLHNSGLHSLRKIQYQSINKGLFDDYSFLISTPSGSGKTLIGELAAINTILTSNRSALYLVPLKALATEKYHTFNQIYQSLNLKIEMAIGDQDISYTDLNSADLLIMTYEKFDSYLRSNGHFDWINTITTIIIDEIHILGEKKRGPRLENLILRIYRLKFPPQLIYLSATIANPAAIVNWFNFLEIKYRQRKIRAIYEDIRPIPLNYIIRHSHNKFNLIALICQKNLEENGQILIFTNSRKDTMNLCEELIQNSAIKLMLEINHPSQTKFSPNKTKWENISPEIRQIIAHGIAYHHAGLNSYERTFIENHFLEGKIKILCTTNTLSAGINTPARTVIIKDILLYHSLNSNLNESTSNRQRFEKKPMNKNLFHQICGRAGRPGFDSKGMVYILAKNVEERVFIEDFYFQRSKNNQLVPKYELLKSSLPKNIDLLQEMVLLKAFETENFTIQHFIDFIQDSLMWYQMEDKNVPIDAYLQLSPLNYLALLKTITSKQQIILLKQLNISIKFLKFIPMDYLDLEIEISIKHESNLEKMLSNNKEKHLVLNNDISKQISQMKKNISPVKIHFSLKKGIICNCNLCKKSRWRTKQDLHRNFMSKYCIYVSTTIYTFKFILDSVYEKKTLPQSIHLSENSYKDQIMENLNQFELFFNKTIFSGTIIDDLLRFRVIQGTDNVLKTYTCTKLGKIGLQNYLVPRIVSEIAIKFTDVFQNENDVNFQTIFPIFEEILKKQNKKIFSNFKETIQLWINEAPIEEILLNINSQENNRRIYISDFYSIIESLTRLIKFADDYLQVFYPKFNRKDLNCAYFRIKYGIKEELIPWLEIFKNEDPRVFRNFIDGGVKTPEEFLTSSPQKLEKIGVFNKNKIRELQLLGFSKN